MALVAEQYFEVETVERWREVECGALLSLPQTDQLKHTSLEAIAALPTGTALTSEITVSAEGVVKVLLKQLTFGFDEIAFLPLLRLATPSIAPGVRMLMGEHEPTTGVNVKVFPEWRKLTDGIKSPGPQPQTSGLRTNLPKPPATWPWDIRRALSTLAAAGGGRLELTVKNLERDARLVREISDLYEHLLAGGYAYPEERSITAGQLNCKTMLEDPAILGFEVSITREAAHPTLENLVAMALFGTLAGKSPPETADNDLRLIAGSRQVPGRIVPTCEETAAMLGITPIKAGWDAKTWRLGRSSGGIDVTLADSDRARHVYVIGATGTGKSTLLKSLVRQDVASGESVIVIDPHGDLVDDIAAEIPSCRTKDLIYADAANLDGRFGIDLLPESADSTSFEIAADMLVSIFKGAIYTDTPEGFGPVFESYFRNALALLPGADEPDRSLATFPRVFDDPRYRRQLIEACTIPSVSGFWRTATRTSGEIALENVTPYITSKLTRFIASAHARAMFPTSDKCLDFESAMDGGKILLLRCPKGTLGEGLSELAMSASLMKIRAAAMAREGKSERRPVRVYVDEFQNCRGNSLQTLLAEGRKFGISLVLANQSLGQIGGTNNNSIGAATLANVGNLLTFRLGAVDAMKLAPWLNAPDRWRELCQLPDFIMNARLLEEGRPVNYQGLIASS